MTIGSYQSQKVMNIRLLYIALSFIVSASLLSAQEYRSFDGRGNNQLPGKMEWGSVGSSLKYHVHPTYRDSISEPSGHDRPNPRVISNRLFAQPSMINDRANRSDFIWAFGQLIDHELTLVPNDESQAGFMPIIVEETDEFFEEGDQIPMHRSMRYQGTGTDINNYLKTFNNVTAFIDGSAIYGSSKAHADWLRSFSRGKLKTSKGNLLPWNTVTGELGAPVDPTAPFMEDQTHTRKYLFVAGDQRANENPQLIAMHTLFVREHNRLCDEILAQYPDWSDEQVYQKARKMVGATLQAITFEEWLPAMGLNLRSYEGYNPEIQPAIMNVFSAAAFRMGHTMINSSLLRIDTRCEEIGTGHLSLKDVFFNPDPVLLNGIDPLLKGMCVQAAQKFDCRVVDDVRNFLFQVPGAPFKGMDLVAINIQRGRERGLPDYNTVREAFGLHSLESFEEICKDLEESELLRSIYGEVDQLDPWVGMLAEDPMPNTMFGTLMMQIMREQFASLRDGDRFYYENDPGLTDLEKEQIKNTRLSDVVRRNSNVKVTQSDLFFAASCEEMDFESIPVIARDLDMAVYPNPVEESFTVKVFTLDDEPVTVRVTDLNGRVLLDRRMWVEKGYNRFDLLLDRSWPTGVYQLSCYNGRSSNHFRLVKQ